MEITAHAPSKTFTSLIIATILLQGFVLVSGTYLKLTLPEHEVSSPVASNYRSSTSQANRTAELDQATASKIEEDSISDDVASITPEQNIESRSAEEAEVTVTEAPHGPKVITYTVKPGDTLTKVWTTHGADPMGGLKAAEAFAELNVPLSSLRVGDEVELQLSSEGDITGLKKLLSDGRTLILDGNSQEGYVGSLLEPEVFEAERTAMGTISHTFSSAAVDSEVPYAVVDSLVDLFSGRMEFRRDIQNGDSFTVIYTERRTKDGTLLEPGPIKAASIQNNGKFLVAIRHVGKDGQERFFDQYGKPIGDFFLRYPVKFSRISSQFSASRFHPVLKTSRPHNGVDFAAPIGTPVRAVADGVISSAGYNGGAGRMVKIAHSDRYATAYMHLHSIAKGVRPGSRVKRGDVIGTVGKTGLATGPHLHYSFYDRGRYVDPLKIELPTLPTAYDPIPKTYLASTLKTLRRSHEQVQMAALSLPHLG